MTRCMSVKEAEEIESTWRASNEYAALMKKQAALKMKIELVSSTSVSKVPADRYIAKLGG